MALIYRDLVADDDRVRQVTADLAAALGRGRNCLVLTEWVAHLGKLAETLRAVATTRSCSALAWRPGPAPPPECFQPRPSGLPLLVVATGRYAAKGFDSPRGHPVPR